MKVLFICRGNVGRSQMAEAIFNKIAPGGFSSSSVGTKVFDKEGGSNDGEKLSDRVGAEQVLEALREIGIEARDATRKQITVEMVNESDAVVVMAEKDTCPDYLLENTKAQYWEIIDPKGKSLEETRVLRNQINDLVEKLITELK